MVGGSMMHAKQLSLDMDDMTHSPRNIDAGLQCYLSGSKAQSKSLSMDAIPFRRQQEPRLRLCTYNIHGWRDTHHVDNLERLKTVLSRVKADVIALQEVLHPYRPPADAQESHEYFERVKAGKGNGFSGEYMRTEPGLPYLEELAKTLGMPYISFGCATEDGYFGAFGYGNALLSKYPIVRESHQVMIPDERHQANRRIEAENRCISSVTVRTPGGREASLCVTHLDQLSDDLRVDQVHSILSYIGGMGPHILCGDFNVFQRRDCSEEGWGKIVEDAQSKGWTPPPETTGAIEKLRDAGYVDSFYESDNHREGRVDMDVEGIARDTSHPGATCWVVKPLLRIDYAFMSKDLVAGGVRVLQHQRVLDDASDHFPVVVDFSASFPTPQQDTN